MADTHSEDRKDYNKHDGTDRRESDRGDDADLFVTDSHQKEGFGKAAIQIIVGALLFAALAGGYLWWANRTHAAHMLVLDARPLVEKADVASLEAARDKFQEALDTKGGDEKAIAGMAETYTLLWILHGLDVYESDARRFLDDAKGNNIQRAERYFADAMVAYHEGRHDDSIAIAKEVLDRGGVSERLNWTLGLSLRAQGKVKIGRDNLRKAQDSRSGAPHYSLALGDAYEDDNDPRNASHYWSIALNANSKYVAAAARDILTRNRKGEAIEALEADLKKLDELSDDVTGKVGRAAIALSRSAVLYRRGHTKEAAAAADKAIELAGESGMALHARGIALIADGKAKKKGVADIEAAYEKSPGALKYFYAAAQVLSEEGKHDKALKLLNTEEEKLAQIPQFHTAVGDVWLAKRDYGKATAAYDKALKINDRYPEALLGMGNAFWQQRKYDDATSWFEKAVGARRQFPEVYEAIGLMWIEQGATTQANPQLEEAEKIYLSRGTDAVTMNGFYVRVIKALAAKKASSLITGWVAREKAFREGS